MGTKVRKYLQVYAENFCLSKPVGEAKSQRHRLVSHHWFYELDHIVFIISNNQIFLQLNSHAG